MTAAADDPIDDPIDDPADAVSDGDTDSAAERKRVIAEEQDAEDAALGRQRRQNVRVDVQLPLTVRLSGRDATSRTRDLSATGVGFSTRLPVEMDQQCEVTIGFSDWSFTKPVVIKFMKPILAGCVVGAQFESLTEDERERLVKQVFDIQRAQLRNSGRTAR